MRMQHTIGLAGLGCITILGLSVTPHVAVSNEHGGLDHLPCPVIIAQVPFPCTQEQKENRSAGTGPSHRDYLDGARLVLLAPGKEPEVLVPNFHSAADPEISHDGQHVLFSGKPHESSAWNIYELDIANREVRQITRDLGDCRQPNYLPRQFMMVAVSSAAPSAGASTPSGQTEVEGKYTLRMIDEASMRIGFVRELSGTRCEGASLPISRLYSCRPDGSEVRQVTANLSQDLDPIVLPDGRFAYCAWRRNSLERGPLGWFSLHTVNTDGTDVMPICPNVGGGFKRMPVAAANGLLGKLVFVESDVGSWDGAGDLAAVDLRRPLVTYALLKRDDAYVYHSPGYFSPDKILVSRRPRDGSASHAVGILDIAGGTWDPLFDDPRYHDFHAKIVDPRTEPDGRSSVVDDREPLGTLYCLNVNISDRPDQEKIPPGVVRGVRILEGLPFGAEQGGSAGSTADLAAPVSATRRLLGEVPIFPDGSFQVRVPGGVPLEIQLVDKDGMNLRSCGWIWAQNRFYQGCIGCHEDRDLVPDNRMADALWKPAPTLMPPEDQRPTRDFLHDVWPLVVRDCGECHGPKGPHAPRLWQTSSNDPTASETAALEAFTALMDPGEQGWQDGRGRYVVPGHARLSRVIWHLAEENTANTWDGPLADQPAVPMKRPEGRYPSESLKVWIEWIDFGATWIATRRENR